MEILLILAGIVILFFGGEALIKGAIHIAKNLRISELLVSSVIIGFGTSMPEMVVSIIAVFKGSPNIAIGNVVGSNIANILLIIGIAAVISPFTITQKAINRDIFVMTLATILFFYFSVFSKLTILSGILFISILIFYIAYSYHIDKRASQASVDKKLDQGKYLNIYIAAIFSIAGLLLLVLGSALFIEGAISFARKFGISEKSIGLGITAIGSSLPELATIIVAAIRKNGAIAAAGVIGSIIFNIFSIVGVMSIISEVQIPKAIINIDIPLSAIITLFFAFLLLRGYSFNRKIGVLMLLSYAIYFYKLFVN